MKVGERVGSACSPPCLRSLGVTVPLKGICVWFLGAVDGCEVALFRPVSAHGRLASMGKHVNPGPEGISCSSALLLLFRVFGMVQYITLAIFAPADDVGRDGQAEVDAVEPDLRLDG